MMSKLKTFKTFMTMVIHDLRNPTLSLKHGVDLAFNNLNNMDRYKFYQSEMIKLQTKLKQKHEY